MNAINKLRAKLMETQATATEIEAAIQLEYNKKFDDSTILKEAIAKLENSNEYCFNASGEIVAWSRCYDLDKFDDCREYLETWLSGDGIGVNFENECLEMWVGGAFVINDDGDIYDSDTGKFFISKSDYTLKDDDGDDYECETTRNTLIEAYMDKNGYYPGVFRADSHGNVFAVNTNQK